MTFLWNPTSRCSSRDPARVLSVGFLALSVRRALDAAFMLFGFARRSVSCMPSILTMLRQYGITVALLLAGTSAHAQDTPATRTVQPTPLPSTDTTLQAPLRESVPIDVQSEMTLEGGIAALSDGRYAQAAAAFERAIAAQGEDAKLYALLGRARLLAGDHGAAQVALRRAAQLEPKVAEHRLWFGHALRAGGYVTGARHSYGNALALDPNNAEAQAALRALPADADVAVTDGDSPQSAGPKATETASAPEVWYGWQTLALDLTSFVLLGAVVSRISSSDGMILILPGTVLVLGAPVVHWAHGEVGRGFGSLGLRVGLPLVGAGLGCAVDYGSRDFGCIFGAAVGAALGMLSAVFIDAGALASTSEKQPSKPDSAERAALDWRVYAAPTQRRDGMVAGVSGRL
jgi:Flp pilus assembly protein TadD